jgi:hypothetical protein
VLEARPDERGMWFAIEADPVTLARVRRAVEVRR